MFVAGEPASIIDQELPYKNPFLYFAKSDGQRGEALDNSLEFLREEINFGNFFAWSPNGRYLAFDGSANRQPYNVFVADTETHELMYAYVVNSDGSETIKVSEDYLAINRPVWLLIVHNK